MNHSPFFLPASSLNRLWLLLACSLVVAACAPKPDLARLYESARKKPEQPPVVLIHGVMGSKLRDRQTGKEIWPRGIATLVKDDFWPVALRIDPETLKPQADRLEPYAITDQIVGIDFYQSIMRTLEEYGGYHRAKVGVPVRDNKKRYYVFVYDWRLDMADIARQLADFIDGIRTDYAQPDLKVDIVAHSMGGLVSRYYLRYGRTDVLEGNDFPVNLEGTRHVRRSVLLATPNLGSAEALKSLAEGRRLGIVPIPPEVLATMPSLYQLLPHGMLEPLYDPSGKPLDIDIYDGRVWRQKQWSIFDPKTRERILEHFDNEQDGRAYYDLLARFFDATLERARRFQWSLTVKLPRHSHEFVVMGGDCHLTPSHLVVEKDPDSGQEKLRAWPSQVENRVKGVDYERLMLEPGDGKVTKSSLLARNTLDPTVARHWYVDFPLDYPIFLCEKHDRIPGNIFFQDNLLHILLSQ